MKYKNVIWYFLFFTFIVIGFYFVQKSKQEARIPVKNKNSIIVELPNDFIDFYKQFHTDSSFQMSRITFPLGGLPAMIDSTMDIPNFAWYSETWDMHKTYNDFNGTYIREFDNVKGIITERIYDTGHRFEMRNRYSKLGEEWYLIYYAAMNPSHIYQ